MEALLNRLAAALERPRPLGPQVVRFLTDHFAVSREEIPAFLDGRLGDLDEGDLDLLLSPLFTPKLADQAEFAAILGERGVPATEWPGLVTRLAARPTRGSLLDDAGIPHTFTLQPVTLERFVHRLRLDGTVTEAVSGLIREFPAEIQPHLLAIARRAIWNSPGRRDVLERALRAPGDRAAVAADAGELLRLMETSEPADRNDLLARMPAWEEVLRGQITGANQPKAFFNEQVRYLHGGGRDQRQPSPGDADPKRTELAFLGRLRTALAD